MASVYDDEIWEAIPVDRGVPLEHIAGFVQGLGRVDRALDLGCGDGRRTSLLEAAELTAADVSRVALDRALARLPGARLVELDPGRRLPFGDGDFDLVLCAETIEHVQDVQQLLSEVRRVLCPGGTLALTTPAHGRLTALRAAILGFERAFDPLSPHIRFFTRRGLTGLLEEMGFEVVSLRRQRGTLLVIARR